MQESYTRNYIKIYAFQCISILLGFASLFVVVPFLSSDQTIYGIYSVCISVNIFLSYADLGFLGAAQKYAAESFSRNEMKEETRLIGFSHFILLIMVLVLSCIFLLLSYNPSWLIHDISGEENIRIASSLLLILAVSAPITVFQRLLQMIFSIRLLDFQLQKVVVSGNVIKILSVFFFFSAGRYYIVEYYLFQQAVALLVVGIGVWMVIRKFDYPLWDVIRNIRFSKVVFDKTKSLALSGLFVTATWVLYYELDSVVIGRTLGANDVAIFAVGLTLLGFLRSLLGVLYAPFASRFNHFIGLKQEDDLKKFYFEVMRLTFPLVVFPIAAVVIMTKGIIISWVGPDYEASVDVTMWLLACNVLAFVSYPTSLMLVAKEKIMQMYKINSLIVIIYWGGVILSISSWGLTAFAFFKFAAFILSGLTYLWWALNIMGISLGEFAAKIVLPYVPALIVMATCLFLVKDSYISGKDFLNLFLNSCMVGGGVLLALVISLVVNRRLRDNFSKLCLSIKNGI